MNTKPSERLLNILDGDGDELLDLAAATIALRKKNSRTLKRWRDLGTGPAFIRLGRAIFYRRQAIRDWILNQERDGRAAR
jgi:hypothetical protein